MRSLISWTKFLVLLEVGQYRRERFLKDGVDDKDGFEEDGKEQSVIGKPADYLMDRLVLVAGILILGRANKAASGAALDIWGASV
jgi:hypothetical protein